MRGWSLGHLGYLLPLNDYLLIWPYRRWVLLPRTFVAVPHRPCQWICPRRTFRKTIYTREFVALRPNPINSSRSTFMPSYLPSRKDEIVHASGLQDTSERCAQFVQKVYTLIWCQYTSYWYTFNAPILYVNSHLFYIHGSQCFQNSAKTLQFWSSGVLFSLLEAQ